MVSDQKYTAHIRLYAARAPSWTLSSMRFAVSKFWLPGEIQSKVWHDSFVTPSAEVMKGVSIDNVNYQHQWPRKCLKTKAGVNAKIAMGRSMVNPCSQCDFAADTGMGGYCGKCRSRPVVMKSFYQTSYLGGCASQCRGASPRRSYLEALGRQTCPTCKHIYRHNWQVAEFIEEEGSCPKCFHQSG